MKPQNLSVAIIGGGCAGLATATELLLKGVSVSLFERQPFLGGIATGFRDPNWDSSLEYFYHHWFQSDSWMKHYIKVWGVEHKLVFRRPVTVSETQSHGFVQLDSPMSLLTYPNELSMLDKVRMGAAMAYIKALPTWKYLERITAQEWCERYMGRQGFEVIWKPLLEGKFGVQDAKTVNMAWLWARIRCRTSELGTYRGGFRQLFDDVQKWLTARGANITTSCDRPVVELKDDDTWIVNNKKFSHVVVATSPQSFADLFGSFAPLYAKATASRPVLGVQVVILSSKRSLGTHYWYSLHKSNRTPFLALIEHTNFVPISEFGGEHIIYLADYLSPNSAEWHRSDDELINLAVQTCTRVETTFTPSDINRTWVFREPYAQPIVGVNASQNIPELKVSEAPNLYHVSMAHVYPWDRGTNFAFKMGYFVVNEILARSFVTQK